MSNTLEPMGYKFPEGTSEEEMEKYKESIETLFGENIKNVKIVLDKSKGTIKTVIDMDKFMSQVKPFNLEESIKILKEVIGE